MTTPLLGLSEVSEGVVNQATIHNTALRQMEARSFRVLSMTIGTPVVGAAESDSYIIPSGATGVWSGKTNQIACWIGGAWSYYEPAEGLTLSVNDEMTSYSFYGTWEASGGAGATAPFIDSTALLKGSADPTKQVKFEVDGLTTATTRTVTVPDKSGTMAMLDDITDAIADGAANVMVFKGVIDCSANPDYPAANAGDLYKISVAGLIGGGSGYAVQVGDTIYCLADSTAAGNHATVGASWNVANSDVTVSTQGALINAATNKATPVDADHIGLMDSAASNILKKLSWANIKATLKTYFDTLYCALASVNVFTKNQSVAVVSLGSGVSPAIDASLSNNFKITLNANNTLVNPTNLTEGMILNFAITQDATGSRTLAYGSLYKFPSGALPVVSTAANAKDFMSCYYDGAVLLCQMNKAFA